MMPNDRLVRAVMIVVALLVVAGLLFSSVRFAF
ncbi:hypothetical protein BH24CHL5_BH24CHL5_05690 [soil metagenome]